MDVFQCMRLYPVGRKRVEKTAMYALPLDGGRDTLERKRTLPERARILVVEDEVLLAETLVGLLEDGGFTAAGPAGTVAGAMGIVETQPVNGALLDIRLFQEPCYPVAYALRDRDIPFIFVTACQPPELPPDLRSRPFIEKPFQPSGLLQTLRWVLRPG